MRQVYLGIVRADIKAHDQLPVSVSVAAESYGLPCSSEIAPQCAYTVRAHWNNDAALVAMFRLCEPTNASCRRAC